MHKVLFPTPPFMFITATFFAIRLPHIFEENISLCKGAVHLVARLNS
jgi:hypothetical protein